MIVYTGCGSTPAADYGAKAPPPGGTGRRFRDRAMHTACARVGSIPAVAAVTALPQLVSDNGPLADTAGAMGHSMRLVSRTIERSVGGQGSSRPRSGVQLGAFDDCAVWPDHPANLQRLVQEFACHPNRQITRPCRTRLDAAVTILVDQMPDHSLRPNTWRRPYRKRPGVGTREQAVRHRLPSDARTCRVRRDFSP